MRISRPYDMGKFRKEQNKKLNIKDGFYDPLTWIDTGNFALNKMISGNFHGGVPIGSLTTIAGESGCLPASAKVKVRIKKEENTITVLELKSLVLGINDFLIDDLEIDTPDGYQKIISWWDKGILDLVEIELLNGFRTKCAINHLLQNENGDWVLADDVCPGMKLLTNYGVSEVSSITDCDAEECYDFEIDHPNHRYWGDGFSSHNSGKSYIVSGNIVKNALNDGTAVLLIDTENAIKKQWADALGVQTDHPNLIRWPKTTINQVAKTIADFMDEYREDHAKTPREEMPPVLIVVDSLGNLDTETSLEQFKSGELKGDKGIFAKQLKAMLKSSMGLFEGYQVGMVCTNHTYKSQNMYDPDDVLSGGCLVAGTKVWLSNGNTKNIEDMEIGDSVKTMNGDQKVVNLWQYEKPVFELHLSDNQVITCSPEHKFLVSVDPEVWKAAKDIEEGDQILTL